MRARAGSRLARRGALDIARWVGVALAAAAGVAGLGYVYLLRRPLPRCRGRLCLGGLDRDVEVIRDRWGVPHVYADTLHDLFFAQGYVQAQDRLWQMELLRRVASGTLAEVVGELGLATDRFFRRIGVRRAAEVEVHQMDDDARLAVEALAEGVNAFLAHHARRLPVEFNLLGYAPARWTPLDTVAIAKLIGWTLSCNWETELLRARVIDRLGAEDAAALEPSYPEGHPICATPGIDHYGVDGFALAQFREAQRFLGAVGAGAASNAWAVDGSKSATGRPLLANDPHLQPQLPGLWYEVHLAGAGLDVAGASVPGLPGVAIGHNRRIAWGVTMALADTQDLYVERLNPANLLQYERQGRWEDAQVVREVIHVKGRRDPVVEEVVVTRHGPILSPLLAGEQRALALRSAALEPSDLGAALRLNSAANWTEFREAVVRWPVGTLSFVYADVDGNVGYQLGGRIPIRAKGDGLAPAPGWTGEHEWTGYVPPEDMPGALNPPCRYVATANNKIVPDDYPYLISREWGDGYRARRICDLLEAEERHTVASFGRIQRDLYSLPAREFLEHLLQLRAEDLLEAPADAVGARAFAVLRAWDCRLTADSPAAALYETWRYFLLRNVFGVKLGDQVDHYLGLGHESLLKTNAYQIRVTSHLLKLLRERPADWFEQAPGSSSAGRNGASGRRGRFDWPRSWDEALQLSFRDAVLFLRARLGDDPAAWRWGDLHQLTFRHALGVGRLGRVLNRGPYPMGGDADTVCQAATDAAAPFLAHGSTVSYRQIVDLADFDRSVAVLPCGQSGHPGSRHYDDMVRLWRRGEYHPMPFSRPAVLEAAAERLILKAAPTRGAT